MIVPAPPAAGAAALLDGVHGADGRWRPLAPLLLNRADHARLGRLTVRAARLVLAACRRRARTAGELLAALGAPTAHYPLLDHEQPLDEGLLTSIRPDVLTERGVPRFVELNVDGALGGVQQADLIAARFLRHHGARPGLSAPPSAVAARTRAVRAFLGPRATAAGAASVVYPHFEVGVLPALEDPERFARWLAPVFRHARDHGMNMFTHPLDGLTADRHDRLLAGDRPVDAVFRPFVSHGQPAGGGLTALARALAAGTVRMFTPEATMLLTNKRTLAWLWEDLPELDGTEREFVHAHIPRTVPLEHSAALTRHTDWVLKPADGFGGSGVVVGAALSPEQWHRALERAGRQAPHVLQQRVEPDLIPMRFADAETGRTAEAEVACVLGPFLYGSQPSGVLVRHGTPSSGPVLGAHHGAVMNSVLLTGK
ncbi:hypothetical protein ACFV7Q_05085 [Streptomyces sp. NPDC059851]|uniref:hypothetical protein n=1 Tax=Streptomyces sp. NPDC059851 TaxID=3346971 RepID=UPI00364D0E43